MERLLAYRRVKELASFLHESDIVRRCLWIPEIAADVGAGEEVELDWEDVDLRVLAQTYLDVMQRFAASHPPPLEVLPLRYRVEDKMKDIYDLVRSDGLVPLLRHLNSRSDPVEVVDGHGGGPGTGAVAGVFADQQRPFAEIYLRPGDRALDAKELLLREENGG